MPIFILFPSRHWPPFYADFPYSKISIQATDSFFVLWVFWALKKNVFLFKNLFQRQNFGGHNFWRFVGIGIDYSNTFQLTISQFRAACGG